MKGNLKKIISLVLVLALSMVIPFPAFAAEKEAASQLKNEVVLRKTGSKTIKLPTGISKTELSELKNNIQKYGDQVLSQEQVDQINAKASTSGFVYGPWFGGEQDTYQATPSEVIKLVAVLTTAIVALLASPTLSERAAAVIASMIGSYITVSPGQWVHVDSTKKYREVKYSDGTFAYWQTKITASVTRSNIYLGSGNTIISGGMW